MASDTTITSMKVKKRRYPLIVILFITLAACNNLDIVTEPLNPGLLLVSVDGKYGYRDTNGKMVVEPCFPIKTGEYSEGLAAMPETCNTARRWGYINSSGQFMIKPQCY